MNKMCEYCELLAAKDLVIYEDETVAALLAPRPSSLGHILVIPKEHHTIMERTPDDVTVKMFNVANQMSLLLFNNLQVKGTNIFLENGVAAGQQVAHVALHVLGRLPEDGLDFQWEPKELSDEEMSEIEKRIKEGIGVFLGTSEGGQPSQEKQADVIEDDEDNYLTRQLHRRP